MRNTTNWLTRLHFMLLLAAAAAATAQAEYVDEYCELQGSECITYTLRAVAIDAGDEYQGADGDQNYNIDRVFLEINAEECAVPTGSTGATVKLPGNKILGETDFRTPQTYSWRVAANCPYKLHMRHPKTVGYDMIFWHDIDAATAQHDYCIKWDAFKNEKTECNTFQLGLP